MPYSHILFDLDNTLLDFSAASKLAFEDVMRGYGLPYDAEHYKLYGQINKSLWSRIESGKLTQDDVVHSRWSLYFDRIKVYRDSEETNAGYFDGLAKHPVLRPGAIELLNALKGKYHISIVTNGIAVIQHRRIEAANIAGYFDHTFISTEMGCAKPDKRYFDIVFDAIGMEAKAHSIIIGDTLGSDIKGGNDYGIATCWYNPGKKAHFGSALPNYEIQHLNELNKILSVSSFGAKD